MKISIKKRFNIVDTAGKLVSTVFEKKKFDNGQNKETIKLSDVAAGTYIYVLQNRRGKTVASGKFVLTN